jgi:hypothetical protein
MPHNKKKIRYAYKIYIIEHYIFIPHYTLSYSLARAISIYFHYWAGQFSHRRFIYFSFIDLLYYNELATHSMH